MRSRLRGAIAMACLLLGSGPLPAQTPPQVLHYFPSGQIYEYRWKLLELALALSHTQDAPALLLQPYPEDITQSRSALLLQSGAIDVIALGTDPAREAELLPIRIDILKGIIGFRVFLIRRSNQSRIASMDDPTLKQQLVFGLERDWADLPIMLANGFKVETTSNYDSLFAMLDAGRFDAFPRGLNEVYRDLADHGKLHPDLVLEPGKALYFPFPVYFWVNRNNLTLAHRIQRGLTLALQNGTFQQLFTSYYAQEIAIMRKTPRHVIHLGNPNLPAGVAEPDTRWWWTSNR
jgi:hypothetical protein